MTSGILFKLLLCAVPIDEMLMHASSPPHRIELIPEGEL